MNTSGQEGRVRLMSGSNGRPRVFSYLRFSTPEQAMGDSERRQLDEAKKYADRQGLAFDETLADRGLSGYSGTHRKKGSLGRFLQRVKAGEVSPGSILVVENVDRLSREGVWLTLKEVVFDLVEHDVTLHFLSSGINFDREAPNDWRCNYLVSELQRAHAESKRKSDLSRANWRRKRGEACREKRILTRESPAWLRVTDGGRYEVIPGAGDTLRMIFELRHAGVGFGTMEVRLNREAPWKPPPRKGGGRPRKDGRPARAGQKTLGWRISYIKKILRNPAVMGVYQPHVREGGKRVPDGPPIPDYYPQVVDPVLFAALQAQMAANTDPVTGHSRGGGRVGKAHNLLAHLAECAYCGGPMAFKDHGDRGSRWLICDNGRRGVCHESGEPKCARYSVKYGETEGLVLSNCPRLRPDQVLPDPDEQTRVCQSLRQWLQGHGAELVNVERRINNLVDQIADTADGAMRGRYEARVRELEERKAALTAEKAQTERQLRQAEQGLQSFTTWQRNLTSLREALAGGGVEVRERLRAHLRELIDRVEVFTDGHRKLYDPEAKVEAVDRAAKKLGRCDPVRLRLDPDVQKARDGESLAGWLEDGILECNPDWWPDEEFRAFQEYITRRRMSREGRFVRVHFKTGAVVDLVPEGSLATGWEMVREQGRADPWRFVRPDVQKLWEEFRASRKGSNGRGRKRRSAG
jgi:DNA invertase Pin-like site-specific DNA recombinase